jgi:anti-sigma factor RsiW
VAHIEHLLEAYHDRELSPRQRRQVEEHLAVCANCRAQLAALERLSDTLRTFALPDAFPSAETFRTQVALQLPRQPARTRRISWWWYLVPVSLICAVAGLFGLLVLGDWARVLEPVLAWVGVDVAALLPLSSTVHLPGEVARVLGAVGGPLWSVALYVGLLFVFGSYVGWVGVLWRTESQPFSRKEG